MACPLFDLTQANQAWTQMDKKCKAFDALKQVMTSTLVLVPLQDLDPFRIEADSSDFATGVVLSQQSPMDGKWHPVAFYSESLSSVEQNYKIHNKEMLAIIQALEEQKHFLKGVAHLVEIWMDHKNLEYFIMAKKLNYCQACWSLYLACFDFTLYHCPRQFHGEAQHSVLKARSQNWSWQQ